MRGSFMNVVKGVSIGMVAGAAVGVIGKNMMEKNPRMKKKAKKTMKTVGNLLDTAQYMFK